MGTRDADLDLSTPASETEPQSAPTLGRGGRSSGGAYASWAEGVKAVSGFLAGARYRPQLEVLREALDGIAKAKAAPVKGRHS